jgi:RsiW-degrading membrane proteinase PrsW (M82 family)
MTATDTTARLDGLRAWWQVDRTAVIRLGGLSLALVSAVALWPSLIRVGGAAPLVGNIVVHLYVLSWMMLASFTVRTIGVREVLVAFLLGVFVVPSLVFVPGTPVLDWLGATSPVIAVYWAPLLEETALLLVVGLLAWRYTRRAGRAPGLADLFVGGFAVGAGAAIHEDALYGRLLASFPSTEIGPAFERTYSVLYPTFGPPLYTVAGEPTGLYSYHAGHGAYFGLLVGIVILLHRRHAWVWWILPVGWAYGALEHGLANLQLQTGPLAIRAAVGDGHVFAVLLVLAAPAVIVLDHRRRRHAPHAIVAVDRTRIRAAGQRAAGVVDRISRFGALLRHHRNRNAAAYDAARRREPVRLDPQLDTVWLRFALADAASLQPSVSEPPTGQPPAGQPPAGPPPVSPPPP